MSANDTDGNESIDLEPRTERALTEYLTVTPEIGRARGADELVLVTSQSGREYLVDVREDRCECDDATYRLADGGRCKHVRRARFALGLEPIPARALEDLDVDEQLGEHADATPKLAATDGGEILAAGDGGEVLDDNEDERERPDECSCTSPSSIGDEEIGTLPCFACFRAGFDTLNPDYPGDEQAGEGE